ncbi:MAG: MFS transporter [Thermodesulfobacteriota bacterium]|nr:MFS transporter [Thermodesulfobacteriota bacterium]
MVRRVFVTLFISIFSAMLGVGIIIPLLPLYAQTLGATGIWLGIIFSSFSISRSIFMPAIGRLSDRKGRKVFICLGLFGYALVSFGFVYSVEPYQIGIVRFLQGFFAAMILPVAMAYIGEISPENKEGTFMGGFNIALFLGFGGGPLICGLLKDHFGMSMAFYTMGGLSLFGFFLALIFLPELHLYKKETTDKTVSYRTMLGNNIVRGITVFRLVNSIGWGMVMTFLPIFAFQHLGLSGSQIGILISASILVNSFFQAPFGRLADRVSRLKLVVIGGIITSFAISLLPYTHNYTQMLMIAITMGFAGAISIPATAALSVEVGRELGMGSVMGIFSMAMSLGMASGPITGGLLMDFLGIRSVFIFGGSMGFIATGLFFWFMKRPDVRLKDRLNFKDTIKKYTPYKDI